MTYNSSVFGFTLFLTHLGRRRDLATACCDRRSWLCSDRAMLPDERATSRQRIRLKFGNICRACSEDGAWLTPDFAREIATKLYTGKRRFDHSPSDQNKRAALTCYRVALQSRTSSFWLPLWLTELQDAVITVIGDIDVILRIDGNPVRPV